MEVALVVPEEAYDPRMSFTSFDLPEEIVRYLQEADKIQRSMDSSIMAQDRDEANMMLKTVMAVLEDKFRDVLVACNFTTFSDTESLCCSSISSSPSNFRISMYEISGNSTPNSKCDSHSRMSSFSSISILDIDLLPPVAIHSVRCIVQQMVATGYKQECIQAYTSIRKPAVDAHFRMLGIETLSPRDIQMLEWDSLEKKIRYWMQAASVCIWHLFGNEKTLCEQLFEGLSSSFSASSTASIETECFAVTVSTPAMQLLSFAEAVSSSRRSPERLFCMLDLHDTLSDLLPEIQRIFEPSSLASIWFKAKEILSELREHIRGTLIEFEKVLLHDISDTQIPGGAVHPLARYVMRYMRAMLKFKQTLTELIATKPILVIQSNISGDLRRDIEELQVEDARAPFAHHLCWIITLLQFKLDEKSKQYGDCSNSLTYLFLANNLCYVVQKINRAPKMTAMIGHDHFRKLIGKFRLAVSKYQRSFLLKTINYLEANDECRLIPRSELKERLKKFNATFESNCKTQATWHVPDPQLRAEIHISLSQVLIPAYRTFIGLHLARISNGGYIRKYTKYTPEDLENAIFDLFQEHYKSL